MTALGFLAFIVVGLGFIWILCAAFDEEEGRRLDDLRHEAEQR